MKKTGRKILSWVMSVVLCISMVQAFPLPTTKADGDIGAHVHDGITFEAWTSNNSLPSTAGSYYLTKDVTINYEWGVSADINLCLNGHTITSEVSGGNNVISIGAGKYFTLFDCEGTGKITHTTRSNGTIWVSGGHFVMYGGEINDNPNNYGVHTGDGGSFTMYGGTITGMKDMSRAAVTDVSSSGTFNLYGGTISGNKIGVNVSTGNVNLSGNMVIKDNTGGNLYIAAGKTVNIVGELTEGASIGVTMADTTGTFTSGITDATTAETYKAFFTSDNNAFGVMVDTSGQLKLGNPPAAKVGDTEYATFADALSAWTAGTTLQLFTDVTTSSTITVPSGEHTLDLNGHGITRSGSGSVISIGSGATLNLYDCGDTTHYFEVNSTGYATGVNGTSGTNSFKGGYITGGYTNQGGGVYITGGSFNMYGGTIIGNRADTSGNKGGGVYVGNGGSFTLYNGCISYNYGQNTGGGVFLMGGTFTMQGGEISHNRTAWAGGHGVSVRPDSNYTTTFNLYGGSIVYNKENQSIYGAIDVYAADQTVCFNIKGNPTVKNNVSGSSDEVCNITLRGQAMISIVDALNGEDGSIGVYLGEGVVFTNSTNTSYNVASKFSSDKADYGILKNSAGQLEVGQPPHEHDGSAVGGAATFETAWSTANSLPTSAGSYYLTTDVTISSTWNVPSGETSLCLNGHGIRMTGNDSVITVSSSATLKLYDCDTTTEHRFSVADAASNGAGLATVNDALASGYQTFTGGYVTGGKGRSVSSWREGGGIYIEGTVEMYGGNIIGNGVYGTTHGGAFVPRATTAKFVMYGGELRNNAGLCGGAFRYKGGTVEIRGGKIRYNKASGDGGAIHDGVQLLENCEVSNNYAQNGPGGGVWIYSTATTQMKVSGTTVISGNLKGSGTSNVELNNGGATITVGTLESGASIGVTMNNAQPGVFTSGITDATTAETYKAFFTSDNDAYEVMVDASGQLKIGNPPVAKVGDTEYANFADALSAWSDGSTLKLVDDVTTSSTITVPSGTHTLDLNGYGITMTGSGSVFNVGSGVTLNINDSRPTDTTHKFSVTSPASNGAGLATVGSGSQSFTGGYITGGIAQYGGGICVNAGGVLYFDGGTVIGNKIDSNASGVKDGGGICALGGTVYVRGGEICYNEGTNAGGGGLATRTQPNNTTTPAGKIYVSGGSIHHNVASTGGGIRLDGTNSKLYISGGIIENNVYTGSDPAGGIRVDGYGGVEIHMSGNPVIRNNTNSQGEDSNLQLNQPLTIDGELTNTTPIEVKTGIASGVFTNGWSTYMADKDPNELFVSATDGQLAFLNDDGEAFLSMARTISFDANGGTGTMNDQIVPDGVTKNLNLNTFTRTDYDFVGWNSAADGSVDSYEDGAEVTRSSNLTLYAQWELSDRTVTFDANGGEGSMDVQIVPAGVPTRLNLNAFSLYGHYFNGWNTAPDGSGDKYDNIQEVTLYGDLILYAQWEITYVTVAFDANGGEGSMGTQGIPYGIATALNENGFTNTNYLFIGWNTKADGSGDSYPDGQTVTLYGDVTLYAQWAASYRTVTFNANGGKGTMNDQKIMPRVETALTENTFKRDEYEFDGWNTKADGSGDSYEDKGKITLKDDMTLYAQWKVVQAVEIKLDGKATDGITVSGLEELAEELIEENKDDPLLVTMTVETKSEGQAKGYEELKALAEKDSPECDLECFEITLEKTSKGKKTEIEDVSNALEIVIPYKFKGKEDVAFYRYLDGAVKLTETSTKTGADGTYYLDKDNDCIYVYASNFTTYAISAVQCYNVSGAVEFDGDLSSVKIKLTDGKGKEYEIDCGGGEGSWQCDFTHIPRGTYTLTASWEEKGKSYSVTSEVEIRDED